MHTPSAGSKQAGLFVKRYLGMNVSPTAPSAVYIAIDSTGR